MSTASATSAQKTTADLLSSIKFAEACLAKWKEEGLFRDEELQALNSFYTERRKSILDSMEKGVASADDSGLPPMDRCWSCKEPAATSEDGHCSHCGAPVDSPATAKLRYLIHLEHEISKQAELGRLGLASSHAALAKVRDRIKAVKTHLEKDRVLTAKPVVESLFRDTSRGGIGKAPTSGPTIPRRNLMEIVLDPHNIQWLLALGGALFVVGLVIWLVTLGVFENPAFVAVCLGVGNALLLAGGWAMLLKTRYHMAGRALTLLACLVMPLNLWFYHSHGLITLEGHLWVAALVISVLYAASARVLRDPLFVYVFVGGMALTGLMLLADMGKFWEIAAPSTLLVVMGLLALHTERAFPESEEGPFTRKRFGLAFFWSGHAVLASGLLLLLGAQIAGGWLYEPLFRTMYEAQGATQPPVVTELWGKLLALCLVGAGIYAYLYSDLVVRRIGLYVYVAAFLILWAEVLVLDVLGLTVGQEIVIATLAITGLIANLVQTRVAGEEHQRYVRAFPVLGLLLCVMPVAYGVLLHFRATSFVGTDWAYSLSWGYVGAMLATAIACRISAYLYRHALPWLSATYLFATAAATLVGAAGLLSVLGMSKWEAQAPWLMLIPILYMIAARLYKNHATERPMVWVGHAATAVMLVSSLGASVKGFGLLGPGSW
ncbi:MAG TPA: hypothetical protein VGZ25_03680 [Gemmataceae bacterium]|nr:hypothetical protein [Gemmataceae bacterium]